MAILDNPKTEYTIYIAATADTVWEALTEGEMTRQFFFGRKIEADWQVGNLWRMWQPDGTLDVSGKILKLEKPKLLSVTWTVDWIPELRELSPAVVTYDIEQRGDEVRLTMTEQQTQPMDEKMMEGGRRGWPMILSSLKSFLETGKPLDCLAFLKDEEAKTVTTK